MKVFLYIVFLFFIDNIASARNVKPRNRRQVQKCISSCFLLKECDPFLELLRTKPFVARKEIRKSRCGREGIRIKVCCPRKPSIQESYFPYDCGNNPVIAGKIIGGEETRMGEFPWIAALEYKDSEKNTTVVRCAGSLINARYVLTAAHCLHPRYLHSLKLHVVRLGDWDLSEKKDCFKAQNGKDVCAPEYIAAHPEEIILHETFNKNSQYGDDIALIRLNRTVDFTQAKGYIMPICLPSFGIYVELLKRDRKPIVIGWGETETDNYSPILLKTDVPLAEGKQCKKHYNSDFVDQQLCAGGEEMDSCFGDSGGPLMLSGSKGPPYLQIGIVSFGQNCGSKEIPAVYTSVQHYKSWISDHMEPWNE